MTSNVGTIDRVVRILIGVLLIAAPFATGIALFQTTLATIVAVGAGAVLIATSLLRFCPIYRVFGLKTCKV